MALGCGEIESACAKAVDVLLKFAELQLHAVDDVFIFDLFAHAKYQAHGQK